MSIQKLLERTNDFKFNEQIETLKVELYVFTESMPAYVDFDFGSPAKSGFLLSDSLSIKEGWGL